MRRPAMLAAACVCLGACNSEPEVDVRNASVAEVADQVSQADEMVMRPGKWTSRVTVEEVSIPGMPADVAGRMKDMIAAQQPRDFESCLTEEQARRPREEFFGGDARECRYDHFTMGKGQIDAKMRCSRGGGTQVMEMKGSYSPESYAMAMTMSQQGGPAASGTVQMRMRVEARRVGECAPGTQQRGAE